MRLLRSSFLVIGGCALSVERNPIAHVERISICRDEKEKKCRIRTQLCGELLHARRSPSVFFRNENEIIVAGGCLGPNDHSDSCEILRKQNDSTWKSTLAEGTLCVENSCAAFATSENRHLLFGGFNAGGCLSTVQVVNFKDDVVNTFLSSGNLPKLKNSVAVAILFGGWEDEKMTSSIVRRITFSDDFKNYEVVFEKHLPYSVEGHAVVVKDSDIFIIGGFDGISVISTIMKYNMIDRSCQILEVGLNEKRENLVCELIDRRFLIVAGGWSSSVALNSFEVFEVLDEAPFLKRIETDSKETLQFRRNRPCSVAL